MKRGFCCQEMDDSVLEGIVKYVNITQVNVSEFDTFYIEAVKKRDVKKHALIWESVEVDTQDTLLKYCCYCGKLL